MIAAMLIVAGILVSVSYMAIKILSEVVVTPPTSLRELSDQPRELLQLPGQEIIQLQVSPAADQFAIIAYREATGETSLKVYGMGDQPGLLLERGIRGYRLGWLAGSPPEDPSLVYEDAGDIWRLNGPAQEPLNLTAGGSDLDSDPLPSPDGRFILFKRVQLDGEGRVNFWYMRPDGSDARKVSALREMVSWNPDSSCLATYQRAIQSQTTRPNKYYLERVGLPGGAGEFFATSSGEARYVDWLDESTLVYVAMYITPDLSEVKGVVYRIGVDPAVKEKGLGTLKSLNDPDRAYVFYLSRDRERLAYQGDAGLEFLDLGEKRVYRETRVPSFATLDWVPGGSELVFARDDMIYTLKIDTGNTAP